MKESTESLLWDFIVENNIATDDECHLISSINGFKEESMMDIIFARTGLRSIYQCRDEGTFYLSDRLLERFGLDDESDDDEDDE